MKGSDKSGVLSHLEPRGSSSFSKPQLRSTFHLLHLCHTGVALTVALGMRLTLRSLLLLLKELALLLHRRWDQMARRLWYIFGFLRSRSLPRHPERRDEIRPSVERRSTKSNPSPATAVICASRLPPPLTPIPGGDTPLVIDESPTIPIAVRGPTTDDTRQEYNGNDSADHSDVDNYMLLESKPLSRSPDSVRLHDEPEPIEDVLSQNPEDSTSNSPATVSPSNSRPPSRSHRPASPHTEHRLGYLPGPQYSHRPPSESAHHPLPYLNGAEAAASGSLLVPPTQSTRPPSIASSVSSRVYSASKPFTPLRTPYPITDAPRRKNRSSTPASARRRVHEAPLEAPELHQAVHHTSGSIHRDSHSATTSFRPSTTLPEGPLRPMIAIARYEKHRKVKIEEASGNHVLLPITTEFVG